MIGNRFVYAGVMTSYVCSAACRHCMFCSSPGLPKDFMDSKAATRVAGALKRGGATSVHIGGGEPFLNIESLYTLLSALRRERITVDYIETNASWCVDVPRAKAWLAGIRDLGPRCVMASVDPFHIEFVPLERPLRLIGLLDEMGMDSFLWQERFLKRLLPLNRSRPHTHAQLKTALGEDYVASTAAEYGVGPSGRALNIARATRPSRPAQALLTSKHCDLLDGRHCHVDLFENVVPGGCPGIAIALDDFVSADLPMEKYPVAARLINGGTNALFAYAKVNGFVLDDQYISSCDLCFAMRDYLSDAAPSSDIGPKCFYESMRRSRSPMTRCSC